MSERHFTPTYSYDIENRLTSTNGWTYVYDGDGERVKKCNSCSTSTGGTLYWPSSVADTVLETDLAGTRKYEYMFFNGQRIARRDGSSPPYYYFSDHLKSTSVVTNNSGTIQDESDYFPYGGEIVLSNLAPQNYKFTGKERDSESGLDNFCARYLCSKIISAGTVCAFGSNLSNLKDTIRGCQLKLSNGIRVQLGVVPVHEWSHDATEEPCRARKLPSDESRSHS